MDDPKNDKEHDKPPCKNAEMMLQRYSVQFPTIKSNSIHSKPSEPIVPKKPRNVSSLRNKSDQPTTIPSVQPPSEKPSSSFIKRLYHRVMRPEDSRPISNTHASIELESNMSGSQAMSHVRSSRISSHNTNSTDVRVSKLLEIAQSIRNIDLSFDEPDEVRPSSNNYIIPPYYFNEEKMKGKLLDIDFGFTIIDSIRNLRTLTSHQLEYLQSLSNEKLIEIIHEYDHVMKTYVQSLIQDD